MFSKSELQKAARIAEHMTKSAGAFGKLEGNPNMWSDAMPRYNAPMPSFAGKPQAPGFMQSVGNMGKGLYRLGMGAGAAAITGQKGQHGMLENVVAAPFRAARDYRAGASWGQIGHNAEQAVAQPFNRFWRENSTQDKALATAPAAWAGRTWKNITEGPSWGGY